MWAQCPHRWKTAYIDGHREFSDNIHTLFGTSMHEVIQAFLTVMYEDTAKAAEALPLEEMLRTRMKRNFEDILKNIRKMGNLVGHSDRAKIMIDDFNQRLVELQSGINLRPRAALYSANGYTTGAETMAGRILSAAGFKNITEEIGLSYGGVLPLETLVIMQPDIVVSGEAYPGHSRAEEILQHPALRPLKTVTQTDAKWVCGTPAVLDAIAELQRVHPDKGKKQ